MLSGTGRARRESPALGVEEGGRVASAVPPTASQWCAALTARLDSDLQWP